MIASSIDGRIRFRSPVLTDPSEASRIRRALDAKTGVSHVAVNSRTGSLLVEYLPSVLSKADVVEAAGLPDDPAPAPAVAAQRTPKQRARNMRIAKRGMLVSMVAMLLFAAADEERAHIYAGLAFLGFNAYHQYGYRKRLLK